MKLPSPSAAACILLFLAGCGDTDDESFYGGLDAAVAQLDGSAGLDAIPPLLTDGAAAVPNCAEGFDAGYCTAAEVTVNGQTLSCLVPSGHTVMTDALGSPNWTSFVLTQTSRCS